MATKGVLRVKNDVYEKLRTLLDTHPIGCPYSSEIIEILKILFSEDEAKVALGLGFMPFSVEQVALRSGFSPNEAEEHLEAMANRGLVFVREKKAKNGYAMLNSIQIFENPYRKSKKDENIEKLTPLWKKNRSTSLPQLGGKSVSIMRVIPIDKKIKIGAKILPYEDVYEMIDKAEVMGVSNCACREFEQNCDSPREGCMLFGATCTYMVERGFGRYLSKDEMVLKLKEFDGMGLVRQVNNTSDRLEIVCHCCSCCCGFLSAMKNFNNPRAFTRSAFLPVRDIDKCVGCGVCANKRCPMNAIEMKDRLPFLNAEKCIGCGLCSTGCENGAIVMERCVDVPEPPSNYADLGLRLLQERGKLEDFIKLNTP
jgi:Na+-translocating ferredoxin:NAD+ oxidoreductase subunit B